MESFTSFIRAPAAWLAVLWFFLPGRSVAPAQEGLPEAAMGDWTRITIPERDARGLLVWQLNGDRGRKRADGRVEIDRLSVSTYRNSKVDWTLVTPSCVFDQQTREGVSESEVRIFGRNVEITGVGFHWLANEARFIVRSRVRVIIRDGLLKEQPS